MPSLGWFLQVFLLAFLVELATGWIQVSQPLGRGSSMVGSMHTRGQVQLPPFSQSRKGNGSCRGSKLFMSVQGTLGTIAEPKPAQQRRLGSSQEERRRESAPTARSVGIKIVLVGKPCSGKGTQAPMMARRYRCVHISVGNLLRAEVRVGSELGKLAHEYMVKGALLPDDLVISVVQRRLEQDDCKANGWILDGFPRTLAQAQAMQEMGIEPDAVILLDRPDEMVKEWCLGRSFDPTTGIIYHPKYNPPPEEVKPWLQIRDDDKLEVVEKRLDQYHESIKALIACYNDKVSVIDTTKHEVDAFKDVCKVLDGFCPANIADVEVIRVDQLRSIMRDQWDQDYKITFLDIIKYCNAHEMDAFIPVFCAGRQIGYCGQSLAAELFVDSGIDVDFRCALDSCNAFSGEFVKGFVDLAPNCNTEDERTVVVQNIVRRLAANGGISFPTLKEDDFVDVWPLNKPKFNEKPLLRMLRGAEAFFGVPLYGVHINGLVIDDDGREYMWISKRSQSKILYPGLLDQMVSHHQGSLRQGETVWVENETFFYNTVSAAKREAAVSPAMLKQVKSAGMVSYRYETAKGLATKILHVYDLQLPRTWRPYNGNGEVDGFTLMEISQALDHMRSHPEDWKPNAMIVVIDLAVRRGFITPDDPDYLEIVHSLRVKDTFYAPPARMDTEISQYAI